MVEVPVAVMNGTAAAMRSSRLRGRLRMEEVILPMNSTFSRARGAPWGAHEDSLASSVLRASFAVNECLCFGRRSRRARRAR